MTDIMNHKITFTFMERVKSKTKVVILIIQYLVTLVLKKPPFFEG